MFAMSAAWTVFLVDKYWFTQTYVHEVFLNVTSYGSSKDSTSDPVMKTGVINQRILMKKALDLAVDNEKLRRQVMPKRLDPFEYPPRSHLRSDKERPVNSTKPSIVFGIPTVHRPKENYLHLTIASLLKYLDNRDDRLDCLIMILVAEMNSNHSTTVVQWINATYYDIIQEGLLEVLEVNKDFYPEITTMSKTGEDKKRVYWRTKQNLDFIYLMTYSQPRAKYYVQLEDDVITKPYFFQTIKHYAIDKEEARATNKTRPWIYLEFCPFGFIGKLFVTDPDLPNFINYLTIFYNDWPCDWLLNAYTRTRVCPIVLDNKKCLNMCRKYVQVHSPPLFQHMGKHSSLSGKVSKLRLKHFP